jgi:hypothetical protein
MAFSASNLEFVVDAVNHHGIEFVTIQFAPIIRHFGVTK